MTGYAIVAIFVLLAGLMIARVIPALLAVPLMAVAMAAIAGSSPRALGDVVSRRRTGARAGLRDGDLRAAQPRRAADGLPR